LADRHKYRGLVLRPHAPQVVGLQGLGQRRALGLVAALAAVPQDPKSDEEKRRSSDYSRRITG
jgi:hypothetical protein